MNKPSPKFLARAYAGSLAKAGILPWRLRVWLVRNRLLRLVTDSHYGVSQSFDGTTEIFGFPDDSQVRINHGDITVSILN